MKKRQNLGNVETLLALHCFQELVISGYQFGGLFSFCYHIVSIKGYIKLIFK